MYTKLSFVGCSNSGKTTLMAAVIKKLADLGIAVTAVKHSGKQATMDKKGKDSYRFKEAGAKGVILYAENSLYYNRTLDAPLSIGEILPIITGPVDIVLIEGFKYSGIPAFVVINDEAHIEKMMALQNIAAIVSDLNIKTEKPRFKRDDIDKISDFILDYHKDNILSLLQKTGMKLGKSITKVENE